MLVNVDDIFVDLGDVEVKEYAKVVTGKKVYYKDGTENEVFICYGIDEDFFLSDIHGEGYPPESCWIEV